MPSRSSFGSAPGSRTIMGPFSTGAVFNDLKLTVQSQTNALVDPSDLPVADTARMVTDGTNVVLYIWDASATTWYGVQLA